MANRHPIMTEEFKARIKRAQGLTGERLASLAVSVRLEQSVDARIRALPERAAWLRRVITAAAKAELYDPPPLGEGAGVGATD